MCASVATIARFCSRTSLKTTPAFARKSSQGGTGISFSALRLLPSLGGPSCEYSSKVYSTSSPYQHSVINQKLFSKICYSTSKDDCVPNLPNGKTTLKLKLLQSSRFSSSFMSIKSNDDGNGSKENYYNGAYYIAICTILSCILWEEKNNFKVEAARPFSSDSAVDDNVGERGRIISGGGGRKTKGKGNRDRYNFIADVVESVVDAVVCIEVKDHNKLDFFTGIPQTASNGSGFIVDADGLILTNAHVVVTKPRSSFTVRLTDGRTFSAVVEDVDYESDLATIRINAKNLPTLPLGCSADTKIGEWVVAVGAPLALSNTVTSGVVSSVGRCAADLGISNDINYIQTDAAITFGNSGGPLINLDGEVIGINSMKVTAGISFAIPIDHAKQFLARADARRSSGVKKASRKYMGITILTLTDQLRHELETRGDFSKATQGVLVWQVVVGSPAYLAGIQPGDIIIRINGADIKSSAEVYEAAKTADKLQIHVQRHSKLYSCIVIPELVAEE